MVSCGSLILVVGCLKLHYLKLGVEELLHFLHCQLFLSCTSWFSHLDSLPWMLLKQRHVGGKDQAGGDDPRMVDAKAATTFLTYKIYNVERVINEE